MIRHLLIAKKTGQLGNRLTMFAHALAAARERGYILLNPAFVRYAEHFVGTRHLLADCSVIAERGPTPTALVRGLAYAGARMAWESAKVLKYVPGQPIHAARARNEDHLDLRDVLDDADCVGARLVLLQGYHFRHHPWARKHADWIRQFLTPLPAIRVDAERCVRSMRERVEVLIGVHIRHGDYAKHLGGRFFYPVSTYLRLMRETQNLHAPRRVGFLIFSNAQHGADDFVEFDSAVGPGGLVSDLHALSLCDRIIGPPSSFSSWSAFFGKVPVARIQDAEKPLSTDDFIVVDSPDPLY